MAGGKEVRDKIKSIKNTQKITSAMEMVAASKMRKAQERMESARPYAKKIRGVVCHLANAHPEYRHSWLEEREEVKQIGLIVISSDRGLCGGLNPGLFRFALQNISQWKEQGAGCDYSIVGSKGVQFFKRFEGEIISQATQLGDKPHINDLIGAVKSMLSAYDDGKIDKLYLVYNEFENTMTQTPTLEQLLPLQAEKDEKLTHHWDYIYEPGAKDVMDVLMTRYIESVVYQGVVENIACEQSARMVAMKSASDNAGDLIGELELVYNKARQAAITGELADIVGGAAAV